MMNLKRPATIHLQDGVFVPAGIDVDSVRQQWKEAYVLHKSWHDGRVLHVLAARRNGCGGANVHVVECAYRFFALQSDTRDFGVRPLGVKGITTFEGATLWGKRGESVRHYAGLWELAPAGCVEPMQKPNDSILSELQEETGLTLSSPPIQIAMVFDEVALTWELIFSLHVDSNEVHANNEYTDLLWCSRGDEPEDRSPIAEEMMGLLDIAQR